MRGIILAGGKGTRLQPATLAMNKHMIPILEKPMILYPIRTLKSLGITDILIVSGGNHLGMFADFLGDGSQHGISLTYRVQSEAGGIAQALGLAEDFAKGENIAVILGDNVFEDVDRDYIQGAPWDANIFIKNVKNPQRFGVLNQADGKMWIEEKPKEPKSDMAVTGLYLYPGNVFEVIATIKPSDRGEMEITDVNNWYIENNRCRATKVNGFWSDAGTPESLAEVVEWASRSFIK